MGGTVPSEKVAGVEHVQKRMDFSSAINTFLATGVHLYNSQDRVNFS